MCISTRQSVCSSTYFNQSASFTWTAGAACTIQVFLAWNLPQSRYIIHLSEERNRPEKPKEPSLSCKHCQIVPKWIAKYISSHSKAFPNHPTTQQSWKSLWKHDQHLGIAICFPMKPPVFAGILLRCWRLGLLEFPEFPVPPKNELNLPPMIDIWQSKLRIVMELSE